MNLWKYISKMQEKKPDMLEHGILSMCSFINASLIASIKNVLFIKCLNVMFELVSC